MSRVVHLSDRHPLALSMNPWTWGRPCDCSTDLRWLVSRNRGNVIVISHEKQRAVLAYVPLIPSPEGISGSIGDHRSTPHG